jgi:hypothetical protein
VAWRVAFGMRACIWIFLGLVALPATAASQGGSGVDFRLQPWATVFLTGPNPHSQLTPIFLDVRSGDAADPTLRALVGLDLDVDLGKYLTVAVRSHYDTEATNNPLARTNKLESVGPRAELDEAYVTLGGSIGALTVGRRRVAWGPSPLGGLNLSGMAPAADMVHGRLNFWSHHLESFLARLSGEDGLTRLMYGHRFVFNFWSTFSLGLTDVTLTSGDDSRLFWPFLVPFLPTGVVEWRRFPEVSLPPGDQTNSQVSIDFEWRPGPRFFGQWLADDSRVFPSEDTKPHRWAYSLGVEHETGPWTAGYEYRSIMTWTYTHFQDATEMRQFRWPMSAPEGPDMDRHVVWVERAVGPWETRLSGERRRRGENRFGDDWAGGGTRGDPFPSGTVESRWILDGGVGRDLGSYGEVSLSGYYQRISNVNNQLDTDENVLGFRLQFHFQPPPLTNR